jgi:hypothetical protein
MLLEENRTTPDEKWIKTLEDGRKVKFIYQDPPENRAFMTGSLKGMNWPIRSY